MRNFYSFWAVSTMLGPSMKKRLQIDPVSPIILSDLSAEYYFEGKYDLAIQYSKQAIKIDPNFAYGYFYLGFSYERKDDSGRHQTLSRGPWTYSENLPSVPARSDSPLRERGWLDGGLSGKNSSKLSRT